MPYLLAVTVAPEDIDALDHASNLVYLRWVQDAATAHSAAVGLGLAEYRSAGRVFVVRRHTIDYLRPALLGERLEVETRVTALGAASSERQTEIRRAGDAAVLARAVTGWAYIDLACGRPVRIPDDVRERFMLDPPFGGAGGGA